MNVGEVLEPSLLTRSTTGWSGRCSGSLWTTVNIMVPINKGAPYGLSILQELQPTFLFGLAQQSSKQTRFSKLPVRAETWLKAKIMMWNEFFLFDKLNESTIKIDIVRGMHSFGTFVLIKIMTHFSLVAVACLFWNVFTLRNIVDNVKKGTEILLMLLFAFPIHNFMTNVTTCMIQSSFDAWK